MARTGPPAYAWDWFTRQRLLWREVRARLARASAPAAMRYGMVESRGEVIAMLRADYPTDPVVRSTVDGVVAEIAFLGRTDVPFAALGASNAPRGMRWWWTALSGEELDVPSHVGLPRRPPPADHDQLSLDEVLGGYGDGHT